MLTIIFLIASIVTVIRRPWGACWIVSVTERVKTLFFSPLRPWDAAGGAGGGGRGVIPCPLPPRPPPPRQPFQPSPTPSPASRQETFSELGWCCSRGPGLGGPGPKPWAPGPWEPCPSRARNLDKETTLVSTCCTIDSFQATPS